MCASATGLMVLFNCHCKMVTGSQQQRRGTALSSRVTMPLSCIHLYPFIALTVIVNTSNDSGRNGAGYWL